MDFDFPLLIFAHEKLILLPYILTFGEELGGLRDLGLQQTTAVATMGRRTEVL